MKGKSKKVIAVAFVAIMVMMAFLGVVSAITIEHHTLCKDTESTGHSISPVNETTKFYVTDSRAVCLVQIKRINRGDTFRFEWYDPSDLLYQVDNSTTNPYFGCRFAIYSDRKTSYQDAQGNIILQAGTVDVSPPQLGWGTCWLSIALKIDGHPPANKIGNWHVDFYYNDEKQFTETFTISNSIPLLIDVVPEEPPEEPETVSYRPDAIVIDFDDSEHSSRFIDTIALTNEYVSKGVIFEGPGGNDGGAILDEDGSFRVSGYSKPNILAFSTDATLKSGGIPKGLETIRFTQVVSYVQINAGSSTAAGSTITMSAFDLSGNLLGSDTITLSPALQCLVIEKDGISKVVISSPASVFVLDNLAFTPIEILVKTPPEVLEGENFTATVNIANVSDFSILLFKLNYDPSVVTLNKIEKGSGIATSNWPHWYSSQNRGMVTIFASSDPSGSPVNGSAELARLEFSVVGSAGDKSALDIQGIIGYSDMESMESIQVIWVDSEVTVMPSEYV